MPAVRRALLGLNEVKIPEIANGEISIPTLYNTVRGSKANEVAQEIIAQSLNLTKEELFPYERR